LASTERNDRIVLSATDRWEITELITRADAAASRRNAEEYAALFTDDAILEGSQGVHRGSGRLRSDVVPIWNSEGDISIHLTLNVEVHGVEDQDDTATVSSVLVILAGSGATTIKNVSLIEQTVVRRGGPWKISRRTVRAVTPTMSS
jgi:hypothetical protein